MVSYTYEDIIMDPEDPRLEGAIGKECYLSDCPKIALDYARNNSSIDRLKSINKESAAPFVGDDEVNWVMVIIKKEKPKPNPKYIPFESVEEFLDEYFLNKEKYTTGILLKLEGIWLREKDTGALCIVTEIWDKGLVIGDTKLTIIRTDVFNDTTEWDELFSKYSFIDGTPCGKLAEEDK